MSLRIRKSQSPSGNEEGLASDRTPADEWGSRLVKLMPSEALGLYGAAVAMIKQTQETGGFDRSIALIIAAVASALLILVIRYKATQDPTTGQGPQYKAIGLALASFMIWLAALAATGEELSPLSGMVGVAYAPLVAMIWVFFVPLLYKGE